MPSFISRLFRTAPAVLFVVVSSAYAKESRNEDTPAGLSTLASTLPERTARVRVIHQTLFGEAGFSSAGVYTSQGVKVTANGVGVGADFALSSHLSLGVGLPLVYSNHAQMDAQTFGTSSEFDRIYISQRKQVAQKLVDIGTCSNVDVCIQRIERGESLPVEAKFRLPTTNELIILPAGVSLKEAVKSLILNGAQQKDGALGMGDLQAGLRYRLMDFSSSNLMQMSMQVGVVFPTGRYRDVTLSERAIGRGFTEVNVGISTDFKLNPFWMLSGSYTIDKAITQASRQRTFVLDNSSLANGTCDAAGQGNNWDGQCTPLSPYSIDERKGFRHYIIGQTSYSLSGISDSLKLWGVTGGLQYEHDSILVVDGEEFPQQSMLGGKIGVTLSGLAADQLIPLETYLELYVPLAGQNQVVAPYKITLNLYGFAQW